MKKFIIFYVVILLFCIVMIITNGVEYSLVLESNSFLGVMFQYKSTSFLIINYILFNIIIVSTLIVTINKNNHIRLKWILFIIIVILSIFIPLGTNYSIGIDGPLVEKIEYMYLWDLL